MPYGANKIDLSPFYDLDHHFQFCSGIICDNFARDGVCRDVTFSKPVNRSELSSLNEVVNRR
jgi:hypothetical protein